MKLNLLLMIVSSFLVKPMYYAFADPVRCKTAYDCITVAKEDPRVKELIQSKKKVVLIQELSYVGRAEKVTRSETVLSAWEQKDAEVVYIRQTGTIDISGAVVTENNEYTPFKPADFKKSQELDQEASVQRRLSPEQCGIVEQSKNPIVRTSRNNDPVGFCGLASSRDLYHQFMCVQSEESCELPSLLQFIQIDRSTEAKYWPIFFKERPDDDEEISRELIKRRNQQWASLLKTSLNGEVYSESCMPVNSFFKKGEVQPTQQGGPNDNFFNWTHGIVKEEIARRKSVSSACKTSPPLLPEGFVSTFAEILQAHQSDLPLDYQLNKIPMDEYTQSYDQIVNEAVNRFVEKTKCKKIKIPPHIIKNKPGPITLKDLRDLLKKGHPTTLALQNEKLTHAIVVSNFKTTCCKGECKTQYQVIDSSQFAWSKTNEHGWIDQDELASLISPNADLKWIEALPIQDLSQPNAHQNKPHDKKP